MTKSINGFKAFDKGMVCKGFKFEEGKTYETEDAKVCETGFHMCINPLDCLKFYDLCDSEFATAEAMGKIDKYDEDSKIATTKIRIGAKLSFQAFVQASVDFLVKTTKNKKTTSDKNSIKLAASGHYSKLEINGQDSVGAGIGIENLIKGKKGCWITLAEWKYDDAKDRYVPICVKSAQIDGKKIKEDTWYVLKDGKFTKVKQ